MVICLVYFWGEQFDASSANDEEGHIFYTSSFEINEIIIVLRTLICISSSSCFSFYHNFLKSLKYCYLNHNVFATAYVCLSSYLHHHMIHHRRSCHHFYVCCLFVFYHLHLQMILHYHNQTNNTFYLFSDSFSFCSLSFYYCAFSWTSFFVLMMCCHHCHHHHHVLPLVPQLDQIDQLFWLTLHVPRKWLCVFCLQLALYLEQSFVDMPPHHPLHNFLSIVVKRVELDQYLQNETI